MLRTAASFAACLAFMGAALAQETPNRVIEGDVLLIERVERTHANVELPPRGMLMNQVEARFGAPSQKLAPVGGGDPRTPPITRWVYPEFTVYFENRHVVNAVVNRASSHERGPRRPERPAG